MNRDDELTESTDRSGEAGSSRAAQADTVERSGNVCRAETEVPSGTLHATDSITHGHSTAPVVTVGLSENLSVKS